jgi:hypothetical protein
MIMLDDRQKIKFDSVIKTNLQQCYPPIIEKRARCLDINKNTLEEQRKRLEGVGK